MFGMSVKNDIFQRQEKKTKRESMKMRKYEYLEVLEGCEVLSIHFEQCVLIQNGSIWARGKCLVKNPTIEQLSILMNEMDY